MQPVQRDCNSTTCRVRVFARETPRGCLSVFCIASAARLPSICTGCVGSGCGWFCIEEEGHQEHLKATQRTIRYMSCTIPTWSADTYCPYFMLYMHALAVWWTTWSCWAAVQLLKGASSFHWQLNMLLWQHPTIHCFVSVHSGEDSSSLDYCIIPFWHSPAPEGLWCINPHFPYESVVYQLTFPKDSRNWPSLHLNIFSGQSLFSVVFGKSQGFHLPPRPPPANGFK